MKQFKIIPTEDYILAVSTEKVVEGEYGVGYAHGIMGKGEGYFIFKHDGTNKSKLNSICTDTYKVIAHLPLNNSPILEGVMLLPEIVVDTEDVEKVATKTCYGWKLDYPKYFIAETMTMNKGYTSKNDYPYQECEIFKITRNSLNQEIIVGTYKFE
jgi:hypothetical protein